MQLIGRLNFGTLHNAAPGDLLEFAIGGAVRFGIRLADDNNIPAALILDSVNRRYVILSGDAFRRTRGVNHGSNYVIELHRSEHDFDQDNQAGRAGYIAIVGEQTYLTIGGEVPEALSLRDFSIDERPANAFTRGSWDLWLEGDFGRANARPVFSERLGQREGVPVQGIAEA